MSTEPPPPRTYSRDDSIEFGRVVNFTDAVFAISLTLLVVGAGIPRAVPVAFVATWLAVVVWFVTLPAQVVLDRWKPPNADEFLD